MRPAVVGEQPLPAPENDRLDHEPVLAEAAAEEAHRQGLPITAHAHGRDGIVAALQAGFDGVEHASFLTPGGPQPDPRVIEALAASGTFISTCIPGTVPGIPLPPIIAAIMDGARALMGSLIEGGTRVVIGPDAGIATTSRTMCSRTPLPTWRNAWAMPVRYPPRPATRPPRATSPTARPGSRPASTPTSSPLRATPSPTSTPFTAASPCSTGDACHQQPTGHA